MRMLAALALFSLVGAVAGAADPATGEAQEPRVDSADALVQSRARPLYRNPPTYPRDALALGLEGWVVLSYVVREDGSTADPVVESSSGIRDFELAAKRAVRGWRFEPATRNGKPVEQCEVRTRLVFAIDLPDQQRGATRLFRNEWLRIQRLVDQGQVDDALARADALAQRRGLNLYETARIAMLRATLHDRAENQHQALASLRAAVAGGDFLGDPDLLVILREAQLGLELDLGEYSRAIDSAQWLLENDSGNVVERIQPVLDQLMELRYGRNHLGVSGYIGDWTGLEENQQPFWTHALLRQQFGLEDIDGEVRALDLRCSYQRVLVDYSPEVAWTTRPDWGDWDVYVYGAPGTRFRLIEYPLVAGDAAPGS